MSVRETTLNDCSTKQLGVHDHPCSIYSNNEQLKRQFVPYIQAGLALGERCIYFVDENTPEFVVAAMQEDGFVLKPYLESGAFLIESTRNAHLSEGHFGEEKMMAYWLQALAAAETAGFHGLRAAVEMTWAISGMPGCDVLAPYEARLNKFIDKHNVSVICQYSRNKFSAAKLKAVVHAHPLLVVNDLVLNNPAVVHPDHFVEGSDDLDLQYMVDNLTLITRLEQAHEGLEESFDELHDLSHSVSHELQEPVSTIRSYQKLLAVRYHGRLGVDADEFITKCNNASAIVERMIDDLWTYARIQKDSCSFVEVDITRTLGLAMKHQNIDSLISTEQAVITHDPLPEVYGNEVQLVDLFRHLIDNAIRHARVAKPQLHISAKPNDGNWEFVVKDNGRGIDRMNAKDVFRMFNRLDKRPGPDGSGMGLPICKKIVEHHDGNIWLESDASAGTEVHFLLPAVGGDRQATIRRRSDALGRRRRHPNRKFNIH
jgi:signal transduction histidine kinase